MRILELRRQADAIDIDRLNELPVQPGTGHEPVVIPHRQRKYGPVDIGVVDKAALDAGLGPQQRLVIIIAELAVFDLQRGVVAIVKSMSSTVILPPPITQMPRTIMVVSFYRETRILSGVEGVWRGAKTHRQWIFC